MANLKCKSRTEVADGFAERRWRRDEWRRKIGKEEKGKRGERGERVKGKREREGEVEKKRKMNGSLGASDLAYIRASAVARSSRTGVSLHASCSVCESLCQVPLLNSFLLDRWQTSLNWSRCTEKEREWTVHCSFFPVQSVSCMFVYGMWMCVCVQPVCVYIGVSIAACAAAAPAGTKRWKWRGEKGKECFLNSRVGLQEEGWQEEEREKLFHRMASSSNGLLGAVAC